MESRRPHNESKTGNSSVTNERLHDVEGWRGRPAVPATVRVRGQASHNRSAHEGPHGRSRRCSKPLGESNPPFQTHPRTVEQHWDEEESHERPARAEDAKHGRHDLLQPMGEVEITRKKSFKSQNEASSKRRRPTRKKYHATAQGVKHFSEEVCYVQTKNISCEAAASCDACRVLGTKSCPIYLRLCRMPTHKTIAKTKIHLFFFF